VQTAAEQPQEFSIAQRAAAQGTCLALQGVLAVENATPALRAVRGAIAQVPAGALTVDLAGLRYCDAAGAAVLCEFSRWGRAAQQPVRFVGATTEVHGLLALLNFDALARPVALVHPRPPNVIMRLGAAGLQFVADTHALVQFVCDALVALASTVLHPRGVRRRDVLLYLDRVGVDAVPITMLINFLVGITLAFLGAAQLRQFGAEIYVADLVGIAMAQELGPIMTAILLAGRSGAAFAAELGTMKVSEEVDALVAMGFDPQRFLVLPKLLAALLAMPCLLMIGFLTGIIGGALVCLLFLDVTVFAYFNRMYDALTMWMIMQGLIKAMAFAVLAAGVGCMRGLQVRGGAESVGRYTTSAVVSGIFLIIIANTIFTIIFQYL
jgi:phospholipid/cholesterol/gamma-HCH transport system permease protein